MLPFFFLWVLPVNLEKTNNLHELENSLKLLERAEKEFAAGNSQELVCRNLSSLANSQRNTPAARREPCRPLRVKCAHYGTERQAEQAKQAQSADCGCPRWRTGMAQLRPRPRRGAPEGQGAAAAPCPDFSSPLLSPFRRGVLPSPPSASSSPGTCGGGR